MGVLGVRAVEVQAAESAGWHAVRLAGCRRSVGSLLAAEVKAAEAMAVAVRSVEVVMEVKGAAVTVAVKEEAAVVEEMVSAAGCREPAVRG